MKKIIAIVLTIVFALSATGSVFAYDLPKSFFRSDGGNTYDVTRLIVNFVPGYCDLYDELDFDTLFNGAEYYGVVDFDSSYRTEYPNKDYYLPGYDRQTYVRSVDVILYENEDLIDWTDESACVARLEKAIREFESFDFVGSVEVGFLVSPSQHPVVIITPLTEEQKKFDVSQDQRLNARDVVELMKYIINVYNVADTEKADVNGDGNVNAKDVTALMRAIISK